MSILSKIFSSGATELIKGVGDVVDNLTTTEEERLEAKRKIEHVFLDLHFFNYLFLYLY